VECLQEKKADAKEEFLEGLGDLAHRGGCAAEEVCREKRDELPCEKRGDYSITDEKKKRDEGRRLIEKRRIKGGNFERGNGERSVLISFETSVTP